MRADAIGIDVRTHRWLAFTVAGAAAGLAGGLFAFSKGSIDPTLISIPTSIDFLVMTLLGGVQTVIGPLVGAAAFHSIRDFLMPLTDYWRLLLGLAIIAIVLAFPRGIVGAALELRVALRRASSPAAGPREGAGMSLLSVEGLSKSFGGVVAAQRRHLRRRGRQAAGRHRPQRRRQVDHLQHGGRAARARRGRVVLDGHDITGLAPRRIWRLGVGRTFQVAQTFVSMTVAENVQMALISLATAARGPGGRTPPPSIATRRWRCSIASAWAPTPTGPAASLPTATSSAWSSPSRSPARPSCC